jgi:hypothetical protein
MDKAKVAFIAVAVLAVLAAAGLGFVAKMKFDAAAEARGEKENAAAELDRIYNGAIFPNAGNVEAMEGVVAQFREGRETLTNQLVKGNVAKAAQNEFSPSAFQSKLSDLIRGLHSRAPMVEGRKSVADNFAFGFEAYFGKDTMPAAEEVPVLIQQLTVTAFLVRELYASQVLQIVKIERDAQDKATLDSRQGGDRRREAEPEPEQPRRGKKRAEEKAAPLFTSQKMVIDFTARQNSLLELLNRLNSIKKPFVVVKTISAKKTGDDLRKAPAQETAAPEAAPSRGRSEREPRHGRESRRSRRNADKQDEPAASRRSREAEQAPAATPPAEMPPDLRVVSGADIDPPLNVRLELEIFNFGVEAE